MQSSSVEDTDQSRDQRNAESVEPIDPFFPAESSEFDFRAKRVLKELDRFRDSRTHNRPMLLEDLKELGMAGELLKIASSSPCLSRTVIASLRP